MTTNAVDKILLAHGGGGRLTDQLIRHNILPKMKNDILAELADAAKLELSSSSVCFTTDSYVVKPLFFNGGDIGKLAVCGTINDLAVAGAKPAVLALALIIEEGFEFGLLEKILESAARTAKQNGVCIVAGDTKVVETGAPRLIGCLLFLLPSKQKGSASGEKEDGHCGFSSHVLFS